ncbi:MAG: DMT family transporter [Chloroflexota bacterium]|nr:DMT family transporter [Chloroflexota bacterium]
MRRVDGIPIASYLFLGSAMLIVGTSVVASKIVVETMPIYTASALRFLIAGIVLLVLVRHTGGIPPLPGRLHLIVALQALAGLVVFNAMLLLGLDRTTAIASGIITSSTPAVIALMSVMVGDRLKRGGWLGVILAMLGILIVNLFGTDEAASASQPFLGAVLVSLAVVGEALYTVLGKIAAPSLRPVPMATLVTVYGFLLFLPLAATDIGDLRPGEIPVSGWLALLYLALIVTVVAFALWFQGLQRVPASMAGAFTGMIPVGTILATAIFLDEPVTLLHVLGVVVVVVGIVLVTQGMRPARHATPPGSTAGVPTYPNEPSPAP